MAECYLCGTYIPRGEGFRRNVQTGSSTRIYVGRLRGGAYGQSFGTRTVCSTCAHIQDKTKEGGCLRAVILLISWVVSAFIGVSIAKSSDFEGIFNQPIFGLFIVFLITGCPVWLISWFLETERQKKIRDDLVSSYNHFNEEDGLYNNEGSFDLNSKEFMLKKGETAKDWSNRIINYANQCEPYIGETLHEMAGAILSMADQVAPREGDTVQSYIDRCHTVLAGLNTGVLNGEFDADFPSSGIQENESYDEWVARIAAAPEWEINIRETLSEIKKYVKPHVGESLSSYIERAKKVIDSVDKSIDLFDENSSIQKNETIDKWVCRVGPAFLTINNESCLEDVLEEVIKIAKKAPPTKDEYAGDWLKRVMPLIREVNESSDN